MANYKPGMTPEAYRAWLDKHNISHTGAGLFFGVGRGTSIRWAMGESAIPQIMAMLIDCMTELGRVPPSEYQRKKLTITQHDEQGKKMLGVLAIGWQQKMDEKAKATAEAEKEAADWKRDHPHLVKK